MNTYLALWHEDKESSAIKAGHFKEFASVELTSLKSSYSLISTGTERLVGLGEVPQNLKRSMVVPYMDGSFDFPIKYGYSLVGTNATGSFHVMHPHQDHVLVSANHLYQLSDRLPLQRAPLISNIETVLNAVWDAQLEQNDQIGICGFGNIGSLLALVIKSYFGKAVQIIETDSWRCEKAKAIGFDVLDKKSAATFDVLFHTSATESGMQFCLEHLKIEGRLIELSWYGNKEVSLKLGGVFHSNRLKIISSQVSKISPFAPVGMDILKRKKMAEEVLFNEEFDELITYVAFENAPAFYNKLRRNLLPNGLIWMLKY